MADGRAREEGRWLVYVATCIMYLCLSLSLSLHIYTAADNNHDPGVWLVVGGVNEIGYRCIGRGFGLARGLVTFGSCR